MRFVSVSMIFNIYSISYFANSPNYKKISLLVVSNKQSFNQFID